MRISCLGLHIYDTFFGLCLSVYLSTRHLSGKKWWHVKKTIQGILSSQPFMTNSVQQSIIALCKKVGKIIERTRIPCLTSWYVIVVHGELDPLICVNNQRWTTQISLWDNILGVYLRAKTNMLFPIP